MIENNNISVVIIDDEPHVLEGLEILIPWQEHQVTSIHFFADVIEGCAYIENNPVDILITDVRMPEMTGITLIERIKEIKPDIEIIVMSGYREFDYVKQVMALGARSYLVKPIFEEDLLAVLEPAIDEILRKRSIYYCEQVYDDALLNRYINNEKQLDSNQYKVLQAAFLNRYKDSGVSMIGLWFDENDHDVIFEQLLNIAPSLTWLFEGITVYIILLSSKEGNDVLRLKKTHPSLKIDKIDQIESLNGLKSTYEKFKGQMMLMHHYRQGEGFFFDDVLEESQTMKPMRSFVMDTIEAVHQGDEEKVFDVFKALVNTLDNKKLPILTYRKELIIYFSEVVSEVVSVTELKDNMLGILPEKISHVGLEHLITFIESKLYIMMQSAQLSREQHRDEFKHIVAAYIKENIQKQITIKDMAEALHMHPNYMGKKLRNEFGESFSHYLNRTRIRAAIELFKESHSLTIEEVAYKVGYSSYPLFLKYFKMFNEVTPKAYIQSIKNNS